MIPEISRMKKLQAFTRELLLTHFEENNPSALEKMQLEISLYSLFKNEDENEVREDVLSFFRNHFSVLYLLPEIEAYIYENPS